MELISRSELVKLLEDRKREHYENYESFRNYMGDRKLEHETEYEECKRILTIVVNQPTIEAVPVVHGEWVYDENANDWGIGGWRCSECGCKNNNLGCDPKLPVHWFAGSKFCPQCGADMRKKV